jgi:hypothetical protein
MSMNEASSDELLVAVGLEKVILKPMFLSDKHLTATREDPVGQVKQ